MYFRQKNKKQMFIDWVAIRPEGIMLQSLVIILFRISQKFTSLCLLLFFLCSSLLSLFHNSVPITQNLHVIII